MSARKMLGDATVMRNYFLLITIASCSSPSTSPSPEPTDWCQRVVAGGSSSDPIPIALANANFTYRYFGMAPREAVDAPIIAAFGSADVDLAAYAAQAIDTCALDASTATLGPARVDLRGTVAWIVPGTGDVVVPSGAEAVVLDLRQLPDVPELMDALTRATSIAFATPIARPSLQVTEYTGLPDTWFARNQTSIYTTEVTVGDRSPWPGTAAVALPVAVVTDVAMPPLATELALAIRTANAGAIVGHSVVARAAETTWRGVGSRGLAIRTGELVANGTALPDELAADLPTDDPDGAIGDTLPTIANSPAAAATRASPRALSFSDWTVRGGAISPAQLEADLAISYGVLRGFWRIYDVWPAAIDTAYLAQLQIAAIPVTRRSDAIAVLQHFASSLQDGHVFINDTDADNTSYTTVATIPTSFDVLDGASVVCSAEVPQLHPGDAVLAVDGTPIADWSAATYATIAQGTPLAHAYWTASALGAFEQPTRQFTLQAIDGSTRVETVTGGTAYPAYGPQRASGFLGDLGAPDIYYLNLNGTAANVTVNQMLAQLDTARTGHGLVLDGRGYPSVDVSELIARVIGGPAPSPQFRFPFYEGPDNFAMVKTQYTQPGPTGAPFTLPVTILVGPETQSYAEDLIMILEARHDLTIVGRQTAGSNGNITTTLLPGGLGMAFTGMQVRFNDGSPFHGIGIVADHPSAPTRADVNAGIDRELVDGIAVVRGATN